MGERVGAAVLLLLCLLLGLGGPNKIGSTLAAKSDSSWL